MMRLIDEVSNVKFYDGIDINYISKYNGTEMIVIFIENWEEEVLKHKRDNIIDCILGNDFYDLNKLNNNNIIIYQTNGYLEPVYEAIRKKILSRNDGKWHAIAGFSKIKF